MSNQENNLFNSYVCIKALFEENKGNASWIEKPVNENFIADRLVYLDTKKGRFFNGHYSYNAVINEYYLRKGEKRKNEFDHVVKTKNLVKKIWHLFLSGNGSYENFIKLLDNFVKIVIITREENKDPNVRNLNDPLDRYHHLGMKVLWKRKPGNITKKNLLKEEDIFNYFVPVSLEEFLENKKSDIILL